MEALYTVEETAALRQKARRMRTLMLGIGLAGLAVCVTLCCFVNTAGAAALQIAVIAVSTLAGWAVILLWTVWYAPTKAQYEHMDGVLSAAERETYEGTLIVKKDLLHIPRSIWIRRVTLTDSQGGVQTLSVLADRVDALPERGARIRVEAVRKYILAWEALHE